MTRNNPNDYIILVVDGCFNIHIISKLFQTIRSCRLDFFKFRLVSFISCNKILKATESNRLKKLKHDIT